MLHTKLGNKTMECYTQSKVIKQCTKQGNKTMECYTQSKVIKQWNAIHKAR
jgi:hypothetical protein